MFRLLLFASPQTSLQQQQQQQEPGAPAAVAATVDETSTHVAGTTQVHEPG